MDGSGGFQKALAPAEVIWGTWEELLLASAVRRHGAGRWDSVALEFRTRAPCGDLFTPGACESRFRDLQRRFAPPSAAADDGVPVGVDEVPWLEELRRLRVAELRRDLDRSEISIMSLQQKVKRLEEEREAAGGEPDPGNNNVETAGESVSNRFPDGEPGRSCNESNSTDPKEAAKVKRDAEEDQSPPAGAAGEISQPAADEKSCNASDSGGGGGGSEAHSSASLARLRRDHRRCAPAEDGDVSAERGDGKSGPLIALLRLIRSSDPGSVFVCRHESQDSSSYRKLIRRHVDLEMIRGKLEGGSPTYTPTEMFRDLLLLCANATVYFPKRSPEYTAGVKLRRIVTREMSFLLPPGNPPALQPPDVAVTKSDQPRVTTSSSSSLAGKTTLPLMVACKKRSSVVSLEEKEREKEKPLPLPSAGGSSEQKIKPGVTKGLRTSKNRGGGGGSRERESSMKNSLLRRSSPPPQPTSPALKKVISAAVPMKGAVKKNVGSIKRGSAAEMLRKMKQRSPSEPSPPPPSNKESVVTRQRSSAAEKGKRRGVGRPPKRPEVSGATMKRPRPRREEEEAEAPAKKRGRR